MYVHVQTTGHARHSQMGIVSSKLYGSLSPASLMDVTLNWYSVHSPDSSTMTDGLVRPKTGNPVKLVPFLTSTISTVYVVSTSGPGGVFEGGFQVRVRLARGSVLVAVSWTFWGVSGASAKGWEWTIYHHMILGGNVSTKCPRQGSSCPVWEHIRRKYMYIRKQRPCWK